MMPISILCFGYHAWSPTWKRNQSLMAALAARPGVARVHFVNPAVSLLTPPAQLRRELTTHHRHRWRGIVPYRPVPGVRVWTPWHFLPVRARQGGLAPAERAVLGRLMLRGLGDEPFILYVNDIREEARALIELARPRAALCVFDWSDDFAEFARDPAAQRRLSELTELAIREADLVLCVNANLARRAAALGARVETVVNATGLRAAGEAAQSGSASAGARALGARLRHPVLGYEGNINDHRVDLDLVAVIARRHPEWTLLFLGQLQPGLDRRLGEAPNVVFHPLVPHAELAEYLRLFDVCLIPHLDNAHTAGNNPLKLYDYLTTGKPVVATRIAGLEGFEDVVQVADGHAGFLAALEQAVAVPEPPAVAARRRERARAHTWEARAHQVEAAIAASLAAVGRRAGDEGDGGGRGERRAEGRTAGPRGPGNRSR